MPMKVSSNTNIPINNKPELAKFDVNNDGKLQAAEAAKAIAETLGIPKDEVRVEGGPTPTMVVHNLSQDEVLRTWVSSWKGDFNIPGTGAGNVGTGREFGSGGDRTKVLVNCNLIDKGFIDNLIAGQGKATMVVMPKGDESTAVEIPMQAATAPGYTSWSRGGGSYNVPEKKYLAASVDTAGLRELSNDKGLKFYVRLETPEGKTLWINKDGRAYNNFEIDPGELKPQGNL